MANVLTPQKDFPRALKARIRRRAHELSSGAYDQHIQKMTDALKAGTLKAAEIEAWRPAAGSQ